MTIGSAPAGGSLEASAAAPTAAIPAPPSWPWRREYGVLLGHLPRLEPDSTVLAAGDRWDVEQASLPDEGIELRVFGSGQRYGRFMMRAKPGSRPSPAGTPGGHPGRPGRTRVDSRDTGRQLR